MDLPQSTPAGKQCCKCGQTYPRTLEFWHQDGRTRDGLQNRCRACRNEHQRTAYRRQREGGNRRRKALHVRLRRTVLTHYGGDPPCCACCGEVRWEFLALDHINGGGLKHRNAVGRHSRAVYLWVVREGFPTGFRVLCHNCNLARAFYGMCPHERERLAT